MNKRAFLRLLAALANPAISAVSALAETRLTNWAGNLVYGTDRLLDAASVEQVRSLVRGQQKVKALGTRHCFNSIADSRDALLSLKTMQEITTLDERARTVTVEAGITYGQLCPYLDRKGYALHNLASLPHISVAGACSTATHGSGEKNGNLATSVAAIEFVAADGELIRLSRTSDGELFRGAVVGLGALGVIARITLDVQPRFTVRQFVYENLPLDQMASHFDEIQASGYSVSLFTDWRNKRVNEVWIKSRTDSPRPFSPAQTLFGAKLASRNLHPIAELSAENCTEQMGVPGPWYERLPHFRMGFTPSAGKELQSEYFVPRENAVDAILALERLQTDISPHLLISEIRTIAADDLWMSTCYGRRSVALHFTWKQDWPSVRRVLPIIEKELSPYQPRPHWGKLFTLSPAELRSRYDKLPEFIRLARNYDPNGKFRNDFLNHNLFAG